jgi:hypothetical protein
MAMTYRAHPANIDEREAILKRHDIFWSSVVHHMLNNLDNPSKPLTNPEPTTNDRCRSNSKPGPNSR